MKGFLIFQLILLSVLFRINNQQQNSENKIQAAENLKNIELNGTAYSRGFTHGQTLASEIDTIIERWKKEVESSFETDFENVICSFFEKTTMVDTIKKYCPELLDEVKGIADGAGQKYKTVLALQMSEEIENAGEYLVEAKCTSVSSSKTKEQSTIVAQNMDPPAFLQGFPTLLHIKGEKNQPESYVFTFPGFIGLCGLSKNVAVACNGISMLNHRRDGLPVAFVLRSLLVQNNENEAFDFVQNIPHATPQCYTIGGTTAAKCFECSANSKVAFYPFENNTVTLHTNFANVNRDFNQKYIHLLAEYGKTIDDPYFCPRYFLAFDKIKETGFYLNWENIREILSLTEPEIHPISNDETYGCLIMEMKENPVLHFAPGKPNETEFLTFQINAP